ncbi:hypothetical protein WA538_002181, partial [Blastocystis sp. DL]
MSNLTSLVSIEIGGGCFYWASSFSLIDLPQLQSVKLGDKAFQGDFDRKTINEYPYNYNNTMIMKNLPSLISFVGGGSYNYCRFGSVILENIPSLPYSSIQSLSFYYAYSLQISNANGLQDYISFGQQVPLSCDVIRNQTELNRIPSDVEDMWIADFMVAKQKNLILNQQQSMKNLTIGINALNGVSVLELNGLEALERVIVMRGGMIGGSGRLRVTNCANLSSIDIGEYAFTKYKNLELTNLPMLQGMSIGESAFQIIQTILME